MMLDQYRQKLIDSKIQFILVDSAGVILETSKAFLTLSVGASILDSHPFFEIIPSLVQSKERETIFNCVHLDINGTDFIADISILKEENGTLIIVNDLTQHYTAYQAVAQTRNESIINAELVVLKNIELEERERFKNKFIQDFSHELRNPLTSSISITHLFGNTKLTQEQKEMLDYLKDSHQNLRLLLEDTLSISMIASGRMVLRETAFSLYELLGLIEYTYTAKAKLKGILFEIISEERIPEFVQGDRLRLYQVLVNLLDNALKYTEEGAVKLTVQFNQKRANIVSVHFSVSDTGTGIASENFNKVFDSFSQLDTSAKKGGVGLGLSIVKGLLELMGSHISLKSELGSGSEFSFNLNLKLQLNLFSESRILHKTKGTDSFKTLNNGKKIKLLIVEDDEHLQTVLFKTLIDSGNFFIDLINDGAKVMEALINNSYDLILMDVNLPNSNGDHLTRLIREFPFNEIKKIPIIGITAYVHEDSITQYLQAGMNVVLAKPFEHDELLQTIFTLVK